MLKNYFLLFCLLPIFLNAQHSISGTISDSSDEKIFFATVGLYNAVDSVLVKASASNELGQYEIKNIRDGNYYMEINMLGYKTEILDNVTFPGYDSNTDIVLKENTEIIDGIEIKARVPFMEQKSDRLVVNVANNVTSLNNSLLDVMKQVPGVIIVGDRLRLAGQTNPTIFINGKSTRYMDVDALLRDMPGDNVEKIEVIHQPGAEFDAAGTGPIINIVLKKNVLKGTNGSVKLGLGKGENYKYNIGTSVSHYAGKLNINGNLSYRDNPYFERLDLVRVIEGTTYDQISEDPNFSKTLNSGISLDYDITEKQRIGISTRFRRNTSDYDILNKTSIDFEDEEIDDIELRTTNIQDNDWNLITINPYHSFDLDTSGQKILVDYFYAQFNRNGISTLRNNILASDVSFVDQQFIQNGVSRLQAAKFDYIKPINEKFKLSTGVKISTADLDNDFGAFNEVDGSFKEIENESTTFLFDERIFAVYTKLNWKVGEWDGTIGLRYEDSKREGYAVQLDTTNTSAVNQLFPSFSFGRTVSGPLKASIAYSYRIDRPRYNSLNPFRSYLDPFTFNQGNPTLLPAFTHSTKFNLSYEGQPFFNIEYKYTDDVMTDVIKQNNMTGQTNQVTVNLQNLKNFSTSLFFPLDFIPKLSGYGGVIVNYLDYTNDDINLLFNRSRWTYTTFLSTEFTLPWDINAEVSGWYNSGELDGVLVGEYLYGGDVGFSKKVLNNKGRISVGIDNLLFRPFIGSVEYEGVDLDVISYWDAPVANIKFSYKFGNQFMKRKERLGGSGNEVLNRANE